MQLGKLQEALPEFTRLGVRVAAVSADDAEGARKMVARKGLTFPVLSDPHGTMLKAYQRWDEQQDLALAGTFVIRPDGAVVFFEDDGERYSKRPDVRRLLEVARAVTGGCVALAPGAGALYTAAACHAATPRRG